MRRNSMEGSPVVNIMLLGSTGSGKSASGNTIIGVRETFEENVSPESVTRTCESAQTELDGQTITVIDTVGLSDTSVKIKDVQTQIEQMLTLHSVDVFLMVTRLGEMYTAEYLKVVKWIKDNFGATFLNHTIVLFTHGDLLGLQIEDYGLHVFNNKNEDRSQVTELLKKIESLRIKNAYKRYTEQDYKKTQKVLPLKKCAETVLYALATAVGAVGGCVVGEVVTEVAVAAAGVVAPMMGTALTEVQAAVIGAAGAAAVGVVAAEVAGAGVVASMMRTAFTEVQAAVIGAAGGAATGVTASMMGTEFTAGQGAVIGAAIGAAATGVAAAVAVLAVVAVGSGVYFLARNYSS